MALSKIDTAAIATDAIEAAQLKSDAITAGDVPAGTILQAITKHCTTSGATISTTSYTAVGLDINITPKRSGSHFFVSGFLASLR